jgi:hypothetical protein
VLTDFEDCLDNVLDHAAPKYINNFDHTKVAQNIADFETELSQGLACDKISLVQPDIWKRFFIWTRLEQRSSVENLDYRLFKRLMEAIISPPFAEEQYWIETNPILGSMRDGRLLELSSPKQQQKSACCP